MKLTRLAAMLAVPAALSVAACNGSSSPTFTNAVSANAYIRFVAGAPQFGPVSIYYATQGTTASSPTVASLAYGQATDYLQEPLAASTVSVYGAGTGSSGTPAIGPCLIPQLSNNGIYTIVVGGSPSGTNPSCYVYQDQPYTTGGQIRVHHAAPNAPVGTVEFGAIAAAAAPPGTPFTVAGTATLPRSATNPQGAVIASVSPVSVPSATSPTTFAIGAGGTAVGGTEVSLNTIAASRAFAINSYNQPNTGGTATPPSPAVGISVFALDCTATSVVALPGATCTSGVALVDFLDSK